MESLSVVILSLSFESIDDSVSKVLLFESMDGSDKESDKDSVTDSETDCDSISSKEPD